MNAEPEPGKTIRQIYFIIFCIIILAAWVYIRNLADPEFRPWEIFAVKRDYKQELREQYARYREGNLAATKMLEACADKLAYAGSGKSALAEYIHALRCQVYLDEHKPKMALAEARKAVEVAPEPGRGCIALGDALRALGKDAEAAERRKQVAFTIPTFIAAMRVMAKETSGISSINDLAGKTVVTTQGTTGERLLGDYNKNHALKATQIPGKSDNESFALLEAGKAVAFLTDDVILYSQRATSKIPEAYAISRDPLTIEPLAIMLRKDDPGFKGTPDQLMF